MKILKSRVERQTNETIKAMTELKANAAAIELRANSDDYTGFGPGISGRHSGVSDPTAAAALSSRDRTFELTASQFRDELFLAHRSAIRANSLAKALLAIDPKEAGKLAKETPDARAVCANPACRNDIFNTPNDRAREGRCEPCYRYRKNHNYNERPRELCHPDDTRVGNGV